MTNVIHSAAWQGPCRPTAVSPEVEKADAEKWFADWCQQLKTNGLGRAEDVRLLEPAHVTFSEDWVIKPDQVAKLAPDSGETDVFFIISAGNARGAYEIGNMFAKPIVLDGLNCRNISIAGYTLAKGNEVFVAGEDLDLTKLLSLLRARKVFRQTKILYPTNGVPSFSPDTVWDFEDLQKRLGVTVVTIDYRELSAEMERLLADRAEGQRGRAGRRGTGRQGRQVVPRQVLCLAQPDVRPLPQEPHGPARLQRLHHRLLRVLPQLVAAEMAGRPLPATCRCSATRGSPRRARRIWESSWRCGS